jgi:hypothetical protein
MLGVGRGRPKRGHLASAYSSGSGRLDMGIVPKALPCSLDYKLVTVGVPYAVDHFSSICVMWTLGRSLVVRPWPFTSEVNTGLANPG